METTHPVHPQEAATALTDDQLTTAHTEAMRRLHAAQDDARAWTLAAIARIVRQHFPTAHSVQVTNIPGETAGLDALLDAGDQVLALWDWEQPDECFADTTAFEEVDQLCAQLVYFDNPEDGGAYTLPAPLALVTERLADPMSALDTGAAHAYSAYDTSEGLYVPERVAFHRNGVGGSSFLCIEFRIGGRAYVGISPINEELRPYILDRAEPAAHPLRCEFFGELLDATAAEYWHQFREEQARNYLEQQERAA